MADRIEQERQPVIVLGASGYIGGQVVRALAASRAWRPIAVSRRSAGPGSIAADATDAKAMRGLLSGVGGTSGVRVVNCVAGNLRTMLQATDTLCDAARSLPPQRIVHLSSMAVYGAATGSVAEAQAPVSPVSAYGQAKLDCETRLRRHVDGGGDVVVLRPSCVFGPGSPQWAVRIARLLRRGRLGDLGVAGDGGCNLAFIDDLIATILRALAVPGVSGQAFNVSSPVVPTWNEFLVRFGLALHATPISRIPARQLKIETKLLAPACRILARRFDHPLTEAITPSLLALFGQDIRLDSAAAARLLNMPATSVERMIQITARSLESQPAPQPETTHA
ncbi:MAG TPA: NAD(P)-dependent oxidoreductase [Rhodopila sp.]|nr:NAD(P)-dependent oxidoreductase [Rhodopila sp.]